MHKKLLSDVTLRVNPQGIQIWLFKSHSICTSTECIPLYPSTLISCPWNPTRNSQWQDKQSALKLFQSLGPEQFANKVHTGIDLHLFATLIRAYQPIHSHPTKAE
jgi:hypothetical protein